MSKATKGLIVLLIPFALGFLLGFLARGCSGSKEPESEAAEASPAEITVENITEVEDTTECDNEEPQAREVFYYAPRISYGKTFCDVNDLHLQAADSLGLDIIPENRSDIPSIEVLIPIRTCELYVVDSLRYSMPYLTEGAKIELDSIASAFRDSLLKKDLVEYKPIVTSALRTEEDVNRLRRSGNPNASDNSAHCYGTTFDISWSRYFREDESELMMRPYELTKVLAEVLRDQRNAGRCLVKYEKKECCFHITSLCQPPQPSQEDLPRRRSRNKRECRN